MNQRFDSRFTGIRILITSPSFFNNSNLLKNLKKRIQDIGKKYPPFQLESLQTLATENFSALNSHLSACPQFKQTNILIVGREKITRKTLELLPDLRAIIKFGVGLDNITNYIRLDELAERNIAFLCSKGVNARSVAELTVGLIIATMRNMFLLQNKLKNSLTWQRTIGSSLKKQKIGIIGCGAIGKKVVELLIPFQMEYFLNDLIDIAPWIKEMIKKNRHLENRIHQASKENIYKNCDCITVHVSLNETSNQMINRKVFRKMKKTAILINTSRGEVIEEKDLLWALQTKEIHTAACDVFIDEPFGRSKTDQDLLKLENFFATPHLGSRTVEANVKMGTATINSLSDWLLKKINEK